MGMQMKRSTDCGKYPECSHRECWIPMPQTCKVILNDEATGPMEDQNDQCVTRAYQ